VLCDVLRRSAPAAAGPVQHSEAPAAPQAHRALPGDGPFRTFSLTLDVRTFQAGRRLPLNVASTYVQAVLPPDVLRE
jgi:hypothetical protein